MAPIETAVQNRREGLQDGAVGGIAAVCYEDVEDRTMKSAGMKLPADAGAAAPAPPQGAAPALSKQERESQIIALWNAGHEAGGIAAKLQLKSRNVAIGIVTRARARGEHVLTRLEKLAIADTPTQQARAAAGMGTEGPVLIGYAARAVGNKKCVWPEGHPGDRGFHFCGARAVVGKPYCASHCERAYQKRSVT